MRLRIATFNVENLVSRNRFGPKERPGTAPALSLFDFATPATRESAQASAAIALEDAKRRLTALVLAETRADIVALQEVDNLGVLAPFVSNYLHDVSDIRYGHLHLVDGNDPRGIDVAFMARKSLVGDAKAIRVRSHAADTFEDLGVFDETIAAFGIGPQDRVFNRDCLEVAIDLGDRDLTLFICHFKSMGAVEGDRERTRPLREAEARAVRRIVQQRFGDGWRDANWIIAGDLNDYRERILPGGAVEPVSGSGLDPVFDDFAVDPMSGLPEGERWTCFHRDVIAPDHVIEQHVRLDYLLLSPALAAANPHPPVEIIRRGLPYRVPLDPAAPDRSIAALAVTADRYPLVGWDEPKASDHCPVTIELDIPAGRRGG